MEPDDGLAGLLVDFSRTMLTEFPVQDVLDKLVTRVVDLFPVTGAGVTLLRPDLSREYVAASSAAAEQIEELQIEHREGPCRLAFMTGDAVAVPDLRAVREYPVFGPAAMAAGTAAIFSFPLRHGAIRLGALDLSRDTPGQLTPDQLEAAQTLADVAAAYLLNAQVRSQTQQEAEAYRERALHDPLTGLANRALLFERIEHAAAQATRTDARSAVIFADLDGFKAVNDRYGHAVGDQLLVGVARRLSGVVRPGDTLARVSGDEFVVLCEGVGSPDEVMSLARRIKATFDRPFELNGLTLHMTASLGIAHSGPNLPLSGDLLREADAAMYRAKRAGGGVSQAVILTDAETAGRARFVAKPAESYTKKCSAPDPGGASPAPDPGGIHQPQAQPFQSSGC